MVIKKADVVVEEYVVALFFRLFLVLEDRLPFLNELRFKQYR